MATMLIEPGGAPLLVHLDTGWAQLHVPRTDQGSKTVRDKMTGQGLIQALTEC